MKKIEEARMIEKNKRETREKQKNMIKGMIGEMKGGMEKVKEIDQEIMKIGIDLKRKLIKDQIIIILDKKIIDIHISENFRKFGLIYHLQFK
jgi:hypothetical protein